VYLIDNRFEQPLPFRGMYRYKSDLIGRGGPRGGLNRFRDIVKFQVKENAAITVFRNNLEDGGPRTYEKLQPHLEQTDVPI